MKKGGIREVNSFIAVNSSSPKIISRVASPPPAVELEQQRRAVAQQRRPASFSISPPLSGTRKDGYFNESLEKSDKLLVKIEKNEHTSKTAKKTKKSKEASSVTSSLITERVAGIKEAEALSKNRLRYSGTIKTSTTNECDNTSKLGKNTKFNVEEKKRMTTVSSRTTTNVKEHRALIDQTRTTTLDENRIERKLSVIGLQSVVHQNEKNEHGQVEHKDNFEDYESDFDSCSESSETESEDEWSTKVAKTGNEKAVAKKICVNADNSELQQQKCEFEVIREAVRKENTRIQGSISTDDQLHYNQSKHREPYSDSRSNFFTDVYKTHSLQNFSDARKRQLHSETRQLLKSRGSNLLQMVHLDIMQYTLYETLAIPYDVFMRSYARRDTCQVCTQTSEESASAEIQTKKIYSFFKWTQHPVEIRKYTFDDETNLLEVISGVSACHKNSEDGEFKTSPYCTRNTSRRLSRIVKTIGKEMIALLEYEYSVLNAATIRADKTSAKIGDYVTLINYDNIPYLKDYSITMTAFDSRNQFCLLTVHVKPNDDDDCRSILCIWNIHQPLEPKTTLKSCERVTTCCFAAEDSSFIVAGHIDGSICIWDLQEVALHCQKFKLANVKIGICSPSFTTAEIFKHTSHNSGVIKIDSIKSANTDRMRIQSVDDSRIETIFSMDEENYLIMWNISRNNSKHNEIGSAPWSRVKFLINQVIDTKKLIPRSLMFDVTTFTVSLDAKILLGTSTGLIVIFGSCHKSYKFYTKDGCGVVSCVEVCPYDVNYFAVGYGNGDIRIYHRYYSEPISNLEKPNHLPAGIKSLQWLRSKRTYNFIASLDSHSTFWVYQFCSQDCSSTLICRLKIAEGIRSAILSSYDENSENSTSYVVFCTNKNCIKIENFSSFVTSGARTKKSYYNKI